MTTAPLRRERPAASMPPCERALMLHAAAGRRRAARSRQRHRRNRVSKRRQGARRGNQKCPSAIRSAGPKKNSASAEGKGRVSTRVKNHGDTRRVRSDHSQVKDRRGTAEARGGSPAASRCRVEISERDPRERRRPAGRQQGRAPSSRGALTGKPVREERLKDLGPRGVTGTLSQARPQGKRASAARTPRHVAASSPSIPLARHR